MRHIGGTSRRLLLSVFLLAIAACGVDRPVDPPQVDAALPAEWSFPASRVDAEYGTGGMVATTDRVASEIGAEILRRGGNAVDAAVATHFALAVVNPEAGNIGGGGFMVVRMADGEAAALDFRETAPQAAHRDMYLDEDGRPTERSRVGHLASGVPGSVAGMWQAHERFGSLPWANLVEPAITLADGLVVHERLAQSLQTHESGLIEHPTAAAVLLPDGRAPRVGERLEQDELAATLRRIAENGRNGFYEGRTAVLIEAEMRRGGGLITRDDLAGYRAVWRVPLTFSYRGHTVIAMPPPSSGGVAMAAIAGMLSSYDLASFGFLSVDHVHVLAEASKRAFIDRNTYLADPDFAPQPVEALISPPYADRRRAGIDLEVATPSSEVLPGLGVVDSLPSASSEGSETTHFSIVDADGNAVAVTTTINSLYGSLVMVAEAGFLLNNEMDDFTAAPGTPNQFGIVQGEANAIAPGKRMLSSMSPTIVIGPDGQTRLVTGSPGGPTIISTVLQIVSGLIDFGMDVTAATAVPRTERADTTSGASPPRS